MLTPYEHTSQVDRIYGAMVGRNATDLSSLSTVLSILGQAYSSTLDVVNSSSQGSNHTAPLLRRRTLLQSSGGGGGGGSAPSLAQLGSVLSSIAASISDSTAATSSVLSQAASSIASGVLPPTSAFTSVAQAAQVQSTAIVAAIQSVGNLVQQNNLAAATSQAQQVMR
jgi:hypothetical protein